MHSTQQHKITSLICQLEICRSSHASSVTAHHKSTEALAHRNALLRWYYSIYPLFGYCCVGTEFFYILLYVHHFFPHPLVYQVRLDVGNRD